MKRFLILVLAACCFLPSCAKNTGLMPSYSGETVLQSVRETKETTPAEDEGIELPIGVKECMAYPLGELVSLFLELGFSDIEIVPCELTAVEMQADKVLAVLVDGDADFKKSAKYLADAKIRILYAFFEYDESTKETQGEPTEDSEDAFVYVTASGNKYHSKSDCSDMKDPKEISLSEAEALNYTPCKRCH